MASAWHGLSLAFAGAPLDASPVWTRLDNYAGVTIQRISTTRGRPSEDQKTSTGQVSVYGTDRAGVMDPTNATGPFWSSGATQLDPVKQAAIAIYDPTTSDWWPRFRGYLDKLTYTIYPSGKFATFQLDLVDALDILTDAEVLPGHAGATPPGASVGNAWYATQAVDDRIYAAVVDASTSVLGTMIWPAGLLDVFTGNVDVQDTVYSARTPLLQVVQDACDAEFPFAPNLYVSITGQLSFRGRYARFNPADASYDIGHWYVGDHPGGPH